MPRRGVLLKDLTQADFVMALDAYRDAMGLEPVTSLACVPCGYVKRMTFAQEQALAAHVPSEWVLLPAGHLTSQQLVAIGKQHKLYAMPSVGADVDYLLSHLSTGNRDIMLFDGTYTAYWPRRVFEGRLLTFMLMRMVSCPGKYLCLLGKPPAAFRRITPAGILEPAS